MEPLRRLTAGVSTLLGAGLLIGALAWLPPVAGFLVAVAAAFAWCASLESSWWRFASEGLTIDRAGGAPVRSRTTPRPLPHLTDGPGAVVATGAIAATTAFLAGGLGVDDPTIVALSLLLVVLVVAALSSWRVAVATSLMAFLCFNFFFLPPVGTLTIAAAQHWVALFTLLAVSLVASYLAAEVRHRAEQATAADLARHSAELKSSLLASLGHDLKTPLTALTVAANSVNASWLTDDQRQEQAAIVRAELARLNRLFQNLIDMARIESHAVVVEDEWVAPADITDAAVQQVEASIRQHAVEVDAGDDATLVRLDPRLTSAALAHVLENAAQHSPPGSVISVRITVPDGYVQFAVRDRGPGIAGDLEEIFQRRRTPHTVAPAGVTSGMGLSIARGLLRAQQGSVSAENHPEGGAVLTLILPAAARSARALEPELE